MNPSTDMMTIDTRQGFVAALHAALDLALAQRARRMVWVDADFADWPLDDTATLQRLSDWLHLPQRQLLLLAAQPEALRRRACFMDSYRWWSHAIGVFAPAPDDAADLPCQLLVEDTVWMQLLDKRRWRGRSSQVPTELRSARDGLDALLQRSEPALPVTILGL